MNKYDATNYIKHPSIIVDGNGANFTALNSSLLLIKWHVLFPSRDRKLRVNGSVIIETHTPLGNLPETKQTLIQSMDSKLIQFLNVPIVDNLSYDLTFTNAELVTKSQLTVWEFIPYIPSATNQVIQASNMTSLNNPVTVVVDTAPIVTAITQSNDKSVAAINQSNDEKSTFTVTTSQVSVPNAITATVNGMLIPATPLMAEITVTNPVNAKVKIMMAPPAIGVAYNSVTDYLFELAAGGSASIDSPTCKGAVYGIANTASAILNIAKTVETLAVI
jgi:hypothetical protein